VELVVPEVKLVEFDPVFELAAVEEVVAPAEPEADLVELEVEKSASSREVSAV
jgi:hypothetical protein